MISFAVEQIEVEVARCCIASASAAIRADAHAIDDAEPCDSTSLGKTTWQVR
jgi:hypothetical protein